MGSCCFICLILERVKIGADLLPLLGGRDLVAQSLEDFLWKVAGKGFCERLLLPPVDLCEG